MNDWKTPLDEIELAVQKARDALNTADAAGIEEALREVPDIVAGLLDEVRASQSETTNSSGGS